MDFLGVGVPELFVIIILALIFVGPRDLPQVIGRVAKYARDLRQLSQGFTTEWRREINALVQVEEIKTIKNEFNATKETMQAIGTDIKSIGSGVKNDMEDASKKVNQAAAEAKKAAEAPVATIGGAVPIPRKPEEANPPKTEDEPVNIGNPLKTPPSPETEESSSRD